MKKMMALLMAGALAATGTVSAIAAPAEQPHPPKMTHQMDKKPLPPQANGHQQNHKAPPKPIHVKNGKNQMKHDKQHHQKNDHKKSNQHMNAHKIDAKHQPHN